MLSLRNRTENAPGGGQGGTLLVYRPIHPVRPNRGRLTTEVVRWSYPFDQKICQGATWQFFVQDGQDLRTKNVRQVGQSILTDESADRDFSNRKKSLIIRLPATASQKSVGKVYFRMAKMAD